MAAACAGTKRSYGQMYGMSRGFEASRIRSPMQPSGIHQQNGNATPATSGPRSRPVSPHPSSRKTSFDPSASVVLIGIRGVGKSTLGVFAATAYNRRLIDSEKAFLEATGKVSSEYRKLHGSEQYHEQHNRILETLLQSHSTGAVIICTFGDLEGNGAAILTQYAETHPVVHITRDSTGVQSYLQKWSTERVNQLLIASSALLRTCSNFEFFNLTEMEAGHGNLENGQVSPSEEHSNRSGAANSLALKRVEREFLGLLGHVTGGRGRAPSHHSAYPLSQIDIQDREHTFAVAITLSDILDDRLDLETMQTGADCIEVIVPVDNSLGAAEFLEISRAFARVRRSTILPIMASFRPKGQISQTNPQSLLALTHYCIRLGLDFCAVDLSLNELQIRNVIASRGNTQIIGVRSFTVSPAHGWHDNICFETYEQASKLDCDAVKITIPAENVQDAYGVHHFRKRVEALQQRTRLMAYSTGPRGHVSKLSNHMLTSVEPCTLPKTSEMIRNTGEEPVTAATLTRALFASFILPRMCFYVYGADVSKSLSPAMHQIAYEACGMPHTYTQHSCGTLEDFVTMSREDCFGGSAIAPPFKTSVLALLDGCSHHAKAIGAVNTVIPIRGRSADGALPSEQRLIARRQQTGAVQGLYGFNTDWIGIRACIRKGLSPANAVRSYSTGLICGAGGMARAAIYSMISLGVPNIFVYNRTLDNATALAEYYNDLIESDALSELTYEDGPRTRVRLLESLTSDWPEGFRQPTMIVSCIPRETSDHLSTNFTLPDAWLRSPTGGVVVELAYGEPTSLLATQIEERAESGWVFQDGFDMVPEQAFAQFELLTGCRAPRELMRREILKHAPVRRR